MRVLLGLALSLLLMAFVVCQQSEDPKWMTTTWTANDSQFKAIRQRVHALAGKPQELDREVAASRKKCDSKNVSILDAYWWACAVLERATGDFDYGRKVDMSYDLKKPLALFQQFSRPQSYEFTRAKLLMVAWLEFPRHRMVEVAEALHKHDPQDRAVALTLLYLYQPSAPHHYPQDRSKGEALVKFIDNNFPKDAGTWSKTSWFYYTCWLASKSKADASEAIRRMTEARKLTKSAEQRRLIDQGIEEIRKKEAKSSPGISEKGDGQCRLQDQTIHCSGLRSGTSGLKTRASMRCSLPMAFTGSAI